MICKDEEVWELLQNVEALEGKNAALQNDLKKARNAVKSHQDACNKLWGAASPSQLDIRDLTWMT